MGHFISINQAVAESILGLPDIPQGFNPMRDAEACVQVLLAMQGKGWRYTLGLLGDSHFCRFVKNGAAYCHQAERFRYGLYEAIVFAALRAVKGEKDAAL